MKVIIPAQPGFEVLEYCEDDPLHPFREVVIAWFFDEDASGSYPTAITIDGNAKDDAAIKDPNGQVTIACDRSFKDEFIWRSYQFEQRKKIAAV